MGNKAYSCSSCNGLSGGGEVFKSESQSSLTSSISSTLSGLGDHPLMVKSDPTLLPILLSYHQSVHSLDSP